MGAANPVAGRMGRGVVRQSYTLPVNRTSGLESRVNFCVLVNKVMINTGACKAQFYYPGYAFLVMPCSAPACCLRARVSVARCTLLEEATFAPRASGRV